MHKIYIKCIKYTHSRILFVCIAEAVPILTYLYTHAHRQPGDTSSCHTLQIHLWTSTNTHIFYMWFKIWQSVRVYISFDWDPYYNITTIAVVVFIIIIFVIVVVVSAAFKTFLYSKKKKKSFIVRAATAQSISSSWINSLNLLRILIRSHNFE